MQIALTENEIPQHLMEFFEPVPGKFLPQKSLVGIPWRVALALQQDGWVLRSDIIWSKQNCMPESVRDRPTRSHEYLFLLTKGPRYFYDDHAIAEEVLTGSNGSSFTSAYDLATKPGLGMGARQEAGTRNARSVWSIPTQPFHGQHFACFPPELVERCIRAGTSEAGCCPTCRAPWVRQTTRQRVLDGHIPVTGAFSRPDEPFRIPPNGVGHYRYSTQVTDRGFAPACRCPAAPPVPCIVADIFVGSGTVPLVARALGRHSVGLDLSLTYLQREARERLGLADLARWEGKTQQTRDTKIDDLPLFQ